MTRVHLPSLSTQKYWSYLLAYAFLKINHKQLGKLTSSIKFRWVGQFLCMQVHFFAYLPQQFTAQY